MKVFLAFLGELCYTSPCCDMIAMKREVAAGKLFGQLRFEKRMAGFPWSECQVRKLATSHCTNRYSTRQDVEIGVSGDL